MTDQLTALSFGLSVAGLLVLQVGDYFTSRRARGWSVACSLPLVVASLVTLFVAWAGA